MPASGSRSLTGTLLPLLVVLFALSLPVSAQSGLGVVRGTVTDTTHAVISDASVTLVNTATGVSRSVKTNAAGAYYFGSVPPGPYSLTVEVEHFRKWSGTFQLEVGQNVGIDAPLEVGSLQSAIEVTGAAPVVETEKGSISDVKDALRIHQLPLNGRRITNLFSLTAGVEGTDAPRTNGMKVGATDMVLDGISLVNRFGGGMPTAQPGLDIVQEFRFETAGSDAQYSRPATVTMASKSGTNEIHGDVFETARNNYGGLRSRQRMDGNATPPKYIRNEYGGTASGPIVKNKIFWLFSYEASKLRQQIFAQTAVPTDAIWGGDFSGANDTGGHAYTIYDPLTTQPDGTRTAFPGNVIPSGRISPFAKTMQSVTPKPTNGANPWVAPNFSTYYPITEDMDTQTAKYDQVLSEKDNLSVRFTRSARARTQAGSRFGFPPPGCSDCGGSSLQKNRLFSVFARENHVFAPTLLNELQLSVNRSPNHAGALSDGTQWADKLGLPNPFGASGWPSIYMSDGQFLYHGGWDADNYKDQNMTHYQVEDNITWVRGTHSFQFGFRGRQELNNVREMQQAQGSHTFNSDWTKLYDPSNQAAVSFTGSGLAALELGLPTELTTQYNRGYYYFRQKEIGLYAQDSWKINSRLTINYGLRWDKWTPYHEKQNRIVNFDPSTLGSTGMMVVTPGGTKMENLGIPASVLAAWSARGLTWKNADEAGLPSELVPSSNRNFSPRLGVAYKLTDKFVLRASYGMYYWGMPLSQILQSSRKNAPLNLLFANQIGIANGANHVYALSSTPQATDFVGAAAVSATSIDSTAQNFVPMDPHAWGDDRMQQWTFVVERALGKDTGLRMSYIGNHASNLEQRWAYNDPAGIYNYRAATGLIGSTNADTRRVNPNWSGQAIRHNGFSNSNSLQAEIDHRTSHGLTFQGFYTFAHTMTTTDASGTTSGDSSANAVGSGYSCLVPANNMVMGSPAMTEAQRLRLCYTNSGDVPSHHVRWNGVYELPFGKGRRFFNSTSSVVDHLIGGWSIGFIGDWRGGMWMGVLSDYYLFGDPTISKGDRPNVDIFGKTYQLYFRGFFDSSQAKGANAALVQQLVPTDFRKRVMTRVGNNDNRLAQKLADGSVVNTGIGDLVNPNARNFFHGPGAWNQDISIYKDVQIHERYKLRFTGDFFNAFNHPNDVNPSTTTGLLDISQQANDPRTIQISAKFQF